MAYKRKEKTAPAATEVVNEAVDQLPHVVNDTAIPRLSQLLTTEELAYAGKLQQLYKQISSPGIDGYITVGEYQVFLEIGTGVYSNITKVLKELYHPRNASALERKAAEQLLVAHGWATFNGLLG